MTGLFYIIIFLIATGIALLNFHICRYFHQKMQMLQENKVQLRKFDVISKIFWILPAVMLLPFSFWLNDIWLVSFVLGIASFCGLLSYYDYKISAQIPQYIAWWKSISKFDKLILILIMVISVCAYHYNTSLRSIFYLMCFIVFFVYVFLLKKMKEQQKISYLFSNKHVKLLEILVSNLFYYLCWVIIGIYFISMSINIISLYFDPYDTDGCMDTGICKEGFTFNDCGDGKPCTITKESCLKNNNIWLEDIHSCDTKHKVR